MWKEAVQPQSFTAVCKNRHLASSDQCAATSSEQNTMNIMDNSRCSRSEVWSVLKVKNATFSSAISTSSPFKTKLPSTLMLLHLRRWRRPRLGSLLPNLAWTFRLWIMRWTFRRHQPNDMDALRILSPIPQFKPGTRLQRKLRKRRTLSLKQSPWFLLSFLQWNCRSVKPARTDLVKSVSLKIPDVILLQETWLMSRNSFSFPDYFI